eukprot:CAMPEP_0202979306 /NCGR_PEP_ID=MMETSP1396-20130829/85495_1 /ASSEMBLY_ACC=CAM_ASM_000872 /TAXON_ID= /ORGANISM="Pseudokeronopsis sp., Strain Brazil" /LENGTH=50 /DNA_ID=CAMNT_0049718675 /DNA_START=85 /DNA_END=237 /DNA_ORIENTATION=+
MADSLDKKPKKKPKKKTKKDLKDLQDLEENITGAQTKKLKEDTLSEQKND